MSPRDEDEGHAEDIEDLTTEIENLDETIKHKDDALKLAAMKLVSLNGQVNKLTDALNGATVLIDHLVADLHVHGVLPSMALRAAHSTFREAMNKLLGEPIFSKIKTQLPEELRKNDPSEKPN